ncbi:hypothetical protein DH2020_034113 [Rehmannia glutinosa]|uniref:Uncharacterized protein n=1 Tax=Rehmannia glutinosa TaxID=99300 RepID=A0ABR0VB87_REHGL
MEKMKFAEELVREFLVFRGFTNTLQAFEKELATDIGKGFQVDKILDFIFLLTSPNSRQRVDRSAQLLQKLLFVFRFQSGCSIPYLQNPHSDPQFRVYFSEPWFRALHLSIRNFLSEMLNACLRTPALLKISSERDTVSRLKKRLSNFSLKLSQAQTSLEEKRGTTVSVKEVILNLIVLKFFGAEEAIVPPSMSRVNSTSLIDEREPLQIRDNAQVEESHVSQSNLVDDSDVGKLLPEFSGYFMKLVKRSESSISGLILGHTSPISCSRFFCIWDNIASASIDGTVRIWTYDSSAPTSRNATIYCGAKIMSLEWDCKSDRLELDGGIKAWNVDSKRVVCDLNSTEAYPSILDLKCSPRAYFLFPAAASRRQGTGYFDNLGFASLTVLEHEDMEVYAITSMSFNHNGKLLAAAATDGMIHMFEVKMTGIRSLSHSGLPSSNSRLASHLPIFLTGSGLDHSSQGYV